MGWSDAYDGDLRQETDGLVGRLRTVGRLLFSDYFQAPWAEDLFSKCLI
jgi:hypothetical protein